MPAELQVEGADALLKLGRDLKEIGDKDLRKELFSGLARVAKPLKDVTKQSALQALPKRGGLNEFVANSSIATKTRASGNDPGVRLVVSKKGKGGKQSDLAAINRGRLRHPVFGNRSVWVTQQIAPGFFTAVEGAAGPMTRREMLRVIDEVARKAEVGR